MKKLLMSLLSLAAMLGFPACNAQGQNTPAFQSVDVNTFETIIADTAVIRLDVRQLQEFNEGHIPGAAVIDVLQPDFEEKALARLPKDRTIALYCRSGRRSKKAATVLAENGYTVVELSTGWIGWVNAGKPVEK